MEPGSEPGSELGSEPGSEPCPLEFPFSCNALHAELKHPSAFAEHPSPRQLRDKEMVEKFGIQNNNNDDTELSIKNK